MSISYKGILENVVTFKTETTLQEGDLVKISANDTVAKCTDGDLVDGIVVNVGDGIVSVQVRGFMTVKIASALTLGYTNIEASGSNVVETAETGGRPCTVINYSTTSGTAEILL